MTELVQVTPSSDKFKQVRQLQLQKYLMLNRNIFNFKLARIHEIRAFIRSGGDPSIDPRYKDDYHALITEFGDGILLFDFNACDAMIADEVVEGKLL